MNWIILAILAGLLILVPGVLFATFLGTRDTYTYEKHYGENGFSQEVVSADASAESGGSTSQDRGELDDTILGTSTAEEQTQWPVSEWPKEL